MGNTALLGNGSDVITPTDSQLYMSQVNYTPAECKLMKKYLQSFDRAKRSTPSDLQHMLWHWDQLHVVHQQPTDKETGVAPIMQLFDVFYCYLFQFAPELQPLFHSSAQFQGRALMNIVGGIRNLLMSPNVLETAAGIAHRHVLYGVKCEHFNAFGLALLKTLEVLAPTIWSPEVSTAWHNVYAHVAVLVLTRLSKALRHKRSGSAPSIAVSASPLPSPEPIGSTTTTSYGQVNTTNTAQARRHGSRRSLDVKTTSAVPVAGQSPKEAGSSAGAIAIAGAGAAGAGASESASESAGGTKGGGRSRRKSKNHADDKAKAPTAPQSEGTGGGEGGQAGGEKESLDKSIPR